MKRSPFLTSLFFITLCLAFISGCDSSTTPTPPAGEVLLAEVSGDSTGIGSSGMSSTASTIGSTSLDFTSADSMRISFSYSGTTNNNSLKAFSVYYFNNTDTMFVASYPGSSVTLSPQSIDVTSASPRVNKSFFYKLQFLTTEPGGGYVKFSNLKIYKK